MFLALQLLHHLVEFLGLETILLDQLNGQLQLLYSVL